MSSSRVPEGVAATVHTERESMGSLALMKSIVPGRFLRIAFLLLSCAGIAQNAWAVPSYNRQTGQNCVACHAGGQFPELTPYGRMFKLTGYTIGTRALPLAAMGVVSYNKTANTSDPAGDARADFPKDGNVIFSTGSVFLAGKITDMLGAFVQITYNRYDSLSPDDGHWAGHTQSDNLDIRLVDRFISPKQDLIVGLSLNNNPSVQDVWNSAPAWGFNAVPGSQGPATTPLLAGGLAQSVAGLSAYAYWNSTVYAELGNYRTANGFWSFMSQGLNSTRGDQQIVTSSNPYWRLALTREWGPHNLMVGTMGMIAHVYPDPADPTGPTNSFRDIGLDAQYQYLLDPHSFTGTVSYIKERISYADSLANQPAPLDPDGSLGLNLPLTNATDTLKMLRIKGSYVYHAKYGGTLSFFDVRGSTNSALQSSANDPNNPGQVIGPSVTGNLSGNPATRGFTTEIFWTPVQYARVGLQYTWFNKFNGAGNNYDGFGRNASDNNALFLYVWGAY